MDIIREKMVSEVGECFFAFISKENYIKKIYYNKMNGDFFYRFFKKGSEEMVFVRQNATL